MPRLSELLGDESEIVVSFPAADVHITYRPSVYTRTFEAQLNSLDTIETDEEARDKCDDLLSQLIVSWDLTDEEDEPIRPKRGEIAEKVPAMFLLLFVRRLVDTIAGEVASGRKMTAATKTSQQTAQPTPMPLNRAERRSREHTSAARKR